MRHPSPITVSKTPLISVGIQIVHQTDLGVIQLIPIRSRNYVTYRCVPVSPHTILFCPKTLLKIFYPVNRYIYIDSILKLVCYFSECKASHLGTEYTGHRFYTVSGRICQRWDNQAPHQHNFTESDFPDATVTEANNSCRNPDKNPDGPWCLTSDPSIRREPCGIRLCMKPGESSLNIKVIS